jgi:hypothetical protein
MGEISADLKETLSVCSKISSLAAYLLFKYKKYLLQFPLMLWKLNLVTICTQNVCVIIQMLVSTSNLDQRSNFR